MQGFVRSRNLNKFWKIHVLKLQIRIHIAGNSKFEKNF